jgi:multiple sugar transport system substrate-binding protein
MKFGDLRMPRLNTRRFRGLAIGVTAGLLLAGCSGQTAPEDQRAATVSQADIDKAMNTETTIEFWTWVPNSQVAVDAFEKKYPNINVELVQTNAAEHEQRLRTAISAGTGIPDVVGLQNYSVSSFVLTKDILDLAPYGAADMKDKFTEAGWKASAVGDGVYGIPQDVAPAATFYRKDLFEKAGVQFPTTWDEFAKAAPIIKEKTGSYIANISAADIAVLARQGSDGPMTDWDGNEGVTISVNNPGAKNVVQFWQDLIDKDLVSTEAILTDSWFQGIAAGKYATWTAGAWAPVFLKGPAASSAGLWQVAPMPQWDQNNPVSVNMGGSALAVSKTTKSPIVAAEFAKWIDASQEGVDINTNKLSLFPSTTAILNDPAWTERKDEFFGGQTINAVFADVAKESVQDTPLPFSGYYTSSTNDTLAVAVANKASVVEALDAWQASLVKYAKEQGFTVK